MSAEVFVDTNVFVYARDTADPAKQRTASEWLAWLWETGHGRISHQILQEYYVTVTRKLSPGLSPAEAREDVRDLLAWDPPAVSADLFDQAWSLEDRFGFSWWDSLVVASALAQACDILISEDLQDGQRIDGLFIVNPFTHALADFQ